MSQLLFEIGTEEIPAGYIQPALMYMEQAIQKRFRDLGLGFGQVISAGTPRRLTLAVNDLEGRQSDTRKQHIGPAVKNAFDDNGKPTRAAEGFARSKGLTVDELQIIETPKGKYLMALEELKGQATSKLLPEILSDLLRSIPFPKSMHWAGFDLHFARPIQWLVALYDRQVLDLKINNISAGDKTFGHRFMSPEAVPVKEFDDYSSNLEKKFVIVDPQKRRAVLVDEVRKAVAEKFGQQGVPVLDDNLLDTVTNLVEIPWGVCGSFDKKFLDLPDEALITSMREHQKYFPVVDENGNLMPAFVAVNNTCIKDKELAVSGHERVLRARLEDGLFFFNEDKKKTLASRMPELDGIIFQKKLGTMAAKSKRMEALATWLADKLDPQLKNDASRAALLAKVDLLTEMVGEFPSLQGTIGRDYALLDGESGAVAAAIHEHYLPVRAGGELPESLLGAMIGIADRIDTMVGCFAIKERPTGNKDAFGQRRLALGLIKIITDQKLVLSLKELINRALSGYEGVVKPASDTVEQLLEFIRLRFENDQVTSGVKQEVVTAATLTAFDDLVDCQARIQALDKISRSDDFVVLAGSFKRIKNIIKDNTGVEVDPSLLAENAEKELFGVLLSVGDQVQPLIDAGQYGQALSLMLKMKDPLDRFFDEVMVMAEEKAIRTNRLNLLTALGNLVRQVGDISRMHSE